ncbi:ATP phosphoribosyltransferase [Pontibacter sp. G13]|uniref:ATP phosphoribosyltransferase n=1 Tax=Pontibacter sp. G13 TaxID=3074898 RepID=UPI00288B4B3F|nr:ATP phosphoribosyltransferase [Pontibacter sp. G13]WNJ18722.1 ATP phosphoribosyltransferase [Pontibacter sp. G13]
MEPVLRLAVQKSGRLAERSLEFIKECGIAYSRNKAKLKTTAYNFPLELLFLRDDDIPKYVASGVADIGIIGENVLAEKEQSVELVERMGFSKCRLSVAVPQNGEYPGIQSLEGKKIATSYPNLLKNFLAKQGVTADIHEISGSVEIAPSIGLADAVCDLVSTGSTLLSNGLKEVEVIFRSEAVMIAQQNLAPEKQAILDDLLFRIKAVLRAEDYKYVLMNVPNDSIDQVVGLIPGMKSPTITPLADSGWSSLHSVIKEDDFWEVIDNLRKAGAQGILVVPIEKMIL